MGILGSTAKGGQAVSRFGRLGDPPQTPRAGPFNLRQALADLKVTKANAPKRHKSGQYIGAPEGIDTPAKLTKLRQNYFKTMMEGIGGREWYHDSSRLLSRSAENPEQAARAFGRTSQGAAVDQNTGWGIKANNQLNLGEPVQAGRFHQGVRKDLEAGDPDFGPKLEPFAQGIRVIWDSLVGKRAVHDIWDGRAWGYREKNGKPWDSGFSDSQHEFLDSQADIVLDVANAHQLGGFDDWNHLRTQASAWTGEKINSGKLKVEDAAKGFAEFADKYTARLTRETAPGSNTGHLQGMDAETRRLYDEEARKVIYGPLGEDRISEAFGLLNPRTAQGTGYFEGQTSPGTVVEVLAGQLPQEARGGKLIQRIDPASRELIDASESTYAQLAAQKAYAWHKPVFDSAINQSMVDLADVNIGRALTDPEMVSLNRAAEAKWGFDPDGDPNVVVTMTPDGVALFTFDDALVGKGFKKSVQSLLDEAVLPSAPDMDVAYGVGDSGYKMNAWETQEGRYGQDYSQNVDRPERPRLQAGYDSVAPGLAEKLSELDRRFGKEYGLDVSEHIQRMRKAIAEGGLDGLNKLIKTGALPAFLVAALDSPEADAGVSQWTLGPISNAKKLGRLAEETGMSRAERAIDQGFDERPFAHGTLSDDIDELESGDIGVHIGTYEQASNRIPLAARERGIIPNNLGKPLVEDANILPLRARLGKSLEMLDVGAWNDSARVLDELIGHPDFLGNRYVGEEMLGEAESIKHSFGDDVSGWIESPENRSLLEEISREIQDAGYDSVVYKNAVENEYGNLAGLTVQGQKADRAIKDQIAAIKEQSSARNTPMPKPGEQGGPWGTSRRADWERQMDEWNAAQNKQTPEEQAQIDDLQSQLDANRAENTSDDRSYIILDPANIRSTNAAFDPANAGSSKLLGEVDPRLLGGLAAGAAGSMYSEDAEAGVLGNLSRMTLDDLLAVADRNVPLDKMEAQEGPYLDNLQRQIEERGMERPIDVQVDELGNPEIIADGMHRLAVMRRMGLEDAPVRYLTRDRVEVESMARDEYVAAGLTPEEATDAAIGAQRSDLPKIGDPNEALESGRVPSEQSTGRGAEGRAPPTDPSSVRNLPLAGLEAGAVAGAAGLLAPESQAMPLDSDSPEYIGWLNEQIRQADAQQQTQQQDALAAAQGSGLFGAVTDIATVMGSGMYGGITGDIRKLGKLVIGDDVAEAEAVAEEWMQHYSVPPKTAMGQEALESMGGALSTAGDYLSEGWEYLQDNSMIARAARDSYMRLPERARKIIETTTGLVL